MYFICLKFNSQYWYLLLRRKKICWNFCGIFTKSERLCLRKILTLVRPRKLIAVNFTFYSRCKMHITPVLLKNDSFHNFLNRSQIAFVWSYFKKKKNFTSKNVYVMLMFNTMVFTWTVHVTCSHIFYSFLRTRLVSVFLK